MAANMTNNDTGFFLKTSHRFHTNAMTAYKKAWAAVWKDIEPYKLTIAIISIISTLTALLTLPFSYVHTAFIAKKAPKKDTGATGNDAKKGDKTKTAKQSDDELSTELDSLKKKLEQSKKSGTASKKKVKEQNDELEKLQQKLTDAEKAKDLVNEGDTDSEAHQQELEAIKKERDEANTKIADLEEKIEAANNTDAPADQLAKLTEAENAKNDALAEVGRLKEQLAAAPKQAEVDNLSEKNAGSMFTSASSRNKAVKQAVKQALATQKELHERALATQKASYEQTLATQKASYEQTLATLQEKLTVAERGASGERAAAHDNGTSTSGLNMFRDASVTTTTANRAGQYN